MLPFDDWCDVANSVVGNHGLTILTSRDADRATACQGLAEAVPTHYCSEEHIARALARLGKVASAALIQEKLPTTKAVRSGDLGEILGTEFIAQCTEYEVPIKRLRWKDHRNMAMRGEDVIGISRIAATGRVIFLKCEAKSRVALNAAVVAEARENLERNSGLPSAHAVSFISARLLELGDDALADEIDDALLKHGISAAQVKHLVFVLSGNSSRAVLEASLNAYAGAIGQSAVGLRVPTHAAFVREVYEQVIDNG